MLKALQIKNIVIIERLDLLFKPGLNVLTGETGAGKSIIIDAIRFVLGERISKNLLRPGTQRGEVTVEFLIDRNTEICEIFDSVGLEFEDELIIRRVLSSDGKKQAFLNDNRVTVDLLRNLSNYLIEFHGRHNETGLLNQMNHCAYLDSFLNLDTQALANVWQKINHTKIKLKKLEAEVQTTLVERDFLEYSINELVDLNMVQGEEVTLAEKRQFIRNAEEIRTEISKVLQILNEKEFSGMLSDSMKTLDKTQFKEHEQIASANLALERCFTELGEATETLQNFHQNINYSQSDLEETEDRLFFIRGLARKHQIDISMVPNLKDQLEAKLGKLISSEDTIDCLELEIKNLMDIYNETADKLSYQRKKGAVELDKKMAKELKPLNLDYAKFRIEIVPKAPSSEGKDDVSFTVATNTGSDYGLLTKIASGGELSRFTLAMKVCLSQKNVKPILIFDEIDNGVGGKTANAIGRRLLEISKNEQIFAITHSPQVAALADTHFKVQKGVLNNETFSTIVEIDDNDRIEEIARMLSGNSLTEEARKMAKVLISD